MKAFPSAAALSLLLVVPALAQSPPQRSGGPQAVTRSVPRDQQRSGQPPAPTPAAPPPAGPAENLPPYEAQLMRLSEIMGALAYLRDLCGEKDGGEWQAKMNALIEAEAPSETRRERLAGAFNRGFAGYRVTYRVCTGNAEIAMERFIDEGARIAHDITSRYGGG